jgi:hypothetical protein
VTGTINLVLLNQGLGASFNATVARPLGGRWGGILGVEGGMQPLLSVGLTHGGDSHSVRTAVQLAPDRVGLEVQGAYQADPDTRLKAKASVSTAGAGVVVGAERALNDISRVAASLEVGTRSGVLLRFRCERCRP